ncbi:hypothetical protein FKL64_24000, partial [Escherichia coli]
MTKSIQPRTRKVRILATLGPASSTVEMIAALFDAGADAFRVNMSPLRCSQSASIALRLLLVVTFTPPAL